ncbi:MAG: hypothetical protein R3A45_07210 [Bdellovibrionota bacterium]
MICFGPEGSEGVVCQELCALIDQRGEEIALILIEGFPISQDRGLI